MRKIQLQTSICWHRRAKLKRFSERLIANIITIMDTNFIKVLKADIIHDELSLEEIKGGLISDQDKGDCCTGGNYACNVDSKKTVNGFKN